MSRLHLIRDGVRKFRLGEGRLPLFANLLAPSAIQQADRLDEEPVVVPLMLFGATFVESGFNWPRRPAEFNARFIEDNDQ